MSIFPEDSPALLAVGFEDALIGYGTQFSHDVAIYDYEKCIAILMQRDGMSAEDAEEYFEFNTAGAWVSTNTPVFLRKWQKWARTKISPARAPTRSSTRSLRSKSP